MRRSIYIMRAMAPRVHILGELGTGRVNLVSCTPSLPNVLLIHPQ